ncbi:hypothetical protein ACJJTC_018387 [Scirpophaga incertulas]
MADCSIQESCSFPSMFIAIRYTNITSGVDPMNTKASNLPLEWKNWLMKFNIYLKAYSLDKEPDDRQVAILLHFMGQDCLTIFNSFNFDVNTVKLEELTKKFTHYFSPKVNITMERHKLFNRKQRLHEDLDNYVTDLRNIALQCNFGNLHDSLLKDIFSWNLNDSNYYIKEKLLQEMPKTLDAAIQYSKVIGNVPRTSKNINFVRASCHWQSQPIIFKSVEKP